MDDDFLEELVQTFIQEFEELMVLYRKSLLKIRTSKIHSDERKQAYADLFRIYHTLKGDSGYFPEFEKFTTFTSHFCEKLRPLNDGIYNNSELLFKLRLNYARLTSVLDALVKGRSLELFNFDNY